MTLTITTPAVTEAEADAYAASRGVAAWLSATSGKAEALRRGQDYIAGQYNGRWLTEWTDATAPDEVKYAITEAAAREVVTPFCLSPDVTMGSAKVLVELEGMRWERLGGGGASSYVPVLFAVEALLTGLVSAAGTVRRC